MDSPSNNYSYLIREVPMGNVISSTITNLVSFYYFTDLIVCCDRDRNDFLNDIIIG